MALIQRNRARVTGAEPGVSSVLALDQCDDHADRDIAFMFRHPLAREVATVVIVKTLIVLAAGLLVFGPGQRLRVDETNAMERLLGRWQSLPAPPGDIVIGDRP